VELEGIIPGFILKFTLTYIYSRKKPDNYY